MVYTWDEVGNRTTSKNYLLDQMGWYLIQLDSFEFKYNDQGLLSKKIGYYAYGPPPDIVYSYSINYDYYCDGLLRSEIFENTSVVYEYTEGADCFSVGENLEITISPNPTNGKFSISTALFQSGEIQVNLYDAVGRLVLRKPVKYRTTAVEIDISNFPNGLYMVNLYDNGEMETRKLVLEK